RRHAEPSLSEERRRSPRTRRRRVSGGADLRRRSDRVTLPLLRRLGYRAGSRADLVGRATRNRPARPPRTGDDWARRWIDAFSSARGAGGDRCRAAQPVLPPLRKLLVT